MTFIEFKKLLLDAELTIPKFTALIKVSEKNIQSYKKKEEVPNTIAACAACFAKMNLEGIDYRTLIDELELQKKEKKGAGFSSKKKKKVKFPLTFFDILPKKIRGSTMTINKNVKLFLAIASFMMALAIAIGAFGAHGLKSIVEPALLKTYNTGVEYHFYNTLGLFAASFIIYLKPESKKAVIAAWLILIGMIIFSFSLYFLVILNMPILGAITPIGGTLMIIAWVLLALSILRN